ncbi:MAG: thioredoxin [Candidatus Dadabacteria bacterium]|nr:thioredoxin [Candidatus Dadabacteria bacterium]NIS09136.1 thioredoxin [Candidatus Dadabacteria bacterium]NIY22443.1 thioredoxin [Candidatus Dadabacteria bacterium]
MASGNVNEFSDDNFESEVIKSDLPVLVDFWAPWCGPCRIIAPVVEELSESLAGKLKVGKLNVDDNQQVSMKFGIRSIPTLLVFKNGEVAEQIIGAVPKTEIERVVTKVMDS